jgi:hypothetical protein
MSAGNTCLLTLAGEKSCRHLTRDFSAVPYWWSLFPRQGGIFSACKQRRKGTVSTVEATMGGLAPLWGLLKLELHRLVRSLSRRSGFPNFTGPWQLAQMEFDASV